MVPSPNKMPESYSTTRRREVLLRWFYYGFT